MSTRPQPLNDRYYATGIRGFVKTPVSFLHEHIAHFNYAEVKVLGLIIEKFIGWPNPESEPVEISDAEFDEVAGVTRETWLTALTTLEHRGEIVRPSRNARGRYVYALSRKLAEETTAARVRGKCAKCKKVGFFDREFVPFPHEFFTKLPSCISHCCYQAVAAIGRYTLRWTREHGLYSEYRELTADDIAKVTQQDEQSVLDGIAEGVRLGIIGRIKNPGSHDGDTYWLIPERFGKLNKLGPRLVNQPPQKRGSEKESKPKSGKRAENPANPTTSPIRESSPEYFGICKHCGHFGACEPAPEPISRPNSNSPPKKPPGHDQALTTFPDFDTSSWKKDAAK